MTTAAPTDVRAVYDVYLDELLTVAQAMASEAVRSPALQVAILMQDAISRGNTVYWFGNGGSATDASHLAAEFVGRCAQESDPWPSHALGDSSAVVTAIGNDYGYDQVFARQVEAHVKPGDIAVGLTTSGRSKNVLLGLAVARNKGATTVAMSGEAGLSEDVADFLVKVPSRSTARIQEMHKFIGHFWATTVEAHLASKSADSETL